MRFPLKIASTIAVLVITTTQALTDDISNVSRESLITLNDTFNTYAANYNLEGLISLYDKDAFWVSPGSKPIQGRDEVLRGAITTLRENKGRLSHTIEYLFVSADGTQAVMIGNATVVVEKSDLNYTGTYNFTLKHDGDRWQIVVDMYNQHKIGS